MRLIYPSCITIQKGEKNTFLKVEENDKSALGEEEFKDFDLIMMYSGFLKCKANVNATSYLKMVPNAMHGPPEKCYIIDSDLADFPGLAANSFGKRKAVFIPLQIGSQYGWKGNNGQRALFLTALHDLLKVENTLETDASPLIEMTWMGNRNGSFEWIGIINHSGQIGNSIREPVSIHNTTIRFKPQKQVKELWLMRSGAELKFKQKDGWVECVVPRIDDFEMAVCLYK